jgi:hypothetical protein
MLRIESFERTGKSSFSDWPFHVSGQPLKAAAELRSEAISFFMVFWVLLFCQMGCVNNCGQILLHQKSGFFYLSIVKNDYFNKSDLFP